MKWATMRGKKNLKEKSDTRAISTEMCIAISVEFFFFDFISNTPLNHSVNKKMLWNRAWLRRREIESSNQKLKFRIPINISTCWIDWDNKFWICNILNKSKQILFAHFPPTTEYNNHEIEFICVCAVRSITHHFPQYIYPRWFTSLIDVYLIKIDLNFQQTILAC